jgi:hypothetical protein
MRLVTIAALALTAAALASQQNVKWNLNNSPSGGRNAFPWGNCGIRYQALVDASILGATPGFINDILVPGDTADTTPRTVVYDDIEIRMGMTAATALSTSWTTNSPNPTTVYRGPLRVIFEANAWRSLGLPNSYLYIPSAATPTLCVEVIVWKIPNCTIPTNFFFPANDGGLQRAFLFDWVNTQSPTCNIGGGGGKFGLVFNDGSYAVIGSGCRSSLPGTMTLAGPNATWPLMTWPTRGQPFQINLSGAKPSTPAFLTIGLSDTKWNPLTLPFDLAPVGAPGCFLWNDQLLVLPGPVNAAGNGTVPVPIPNVSEIVRARLYGSFAQQDAAANAFGWTTSNYIKFWTGN